MYPRQVLRDYPRDSILVVVLAALAPMARIRPIPISLLCSILFSVLPFAAAPAADQSPWLEIHSAHFTVITDAGDKKGREIALRFEQMRSVFAILLMKEHLNEAVPLTIFAFKDDKEYFRTAPLRQGEPITSPGFFVPGEDHNFIVLNLFEEESWRAVAHDFAHLLLNYNYPQVQGWFDEGLAEYFGSIRLDNRQVEIGGDPELPSPVAGDLLQNQRDLRNPSKSLTELLSGQVWLALPDLLTMKHDTSSYSEATHHTLFYAQSWMMVHYLLHEKKLPETGTYFDLVENQHLPVEEAIQRAYGVTPTQFDQAVKDYFHSLKPLFAALDDSKRLSAQSNPQQVYQFPEPVGANDNVITSRTITEPDAHALTAEVKVRIPDRREAARQELQTLATAPAPNGKPPNRKEPKGDTPMITAAGNEVAHRVLAWDHMQRGEFEEAGEEFGDAASLNPRDMWIRGPAAAMQAERAAIQLSPRNQQYVYHLAEIYVEDKKWEPARALLSRLQQSSNPQVATKARERLGQIGNEQRYGVSEASGSGKKLVAQSSPFDVLEQDAAKRAAAAQNQQSRGSGDERPAKFLQGRLLDVDCSHAPEAVLTVSSGGTVLKLRTPDYKSLLLIGTDTFSCDWNDRKVSVNYKAGGSSDGDLVSVEVR